jgi:perosamine synthetase
MPADSGVVLIPVCEPVLGEEEVNNATDAIRRGLISGSVKGSYIDAFEKGFSRYCGSEYGIATSSGTTALHLAMASLRLGPGDEVIVPSFTNIATALCVTYTGARPVFVDSEPESWNIDVKKISEAITAKTRAIIVVHIYGHPTDMDPVIEIAREKDVYVVEDAAEAHGAEYRGRKVGGLGDISCFSFYVNKIITTGEGGMVLTNDSELAERAYSLRNLAYSNSRRFLHDEVGFNYRMTNVQAGIGLAQLNKIEHLVERRRRNADQYASILHNEPELVLPIEKSYARNVYWMYGVVLRKGCNVSREQVRQKLLEKGIETRDFFYPMHLQPVFNKLGIAEKHAKLEVSEWLGENGFYLPSGSGLSDHEVTTVAEALLESIRELT